MLRQNPRFFAAAMLITALVPIATPAAATSSADEYKLKGAFVFNFAKFVEWTEGATGKPRTEVRVCVLGDRSVTEVFSKVMQGRNVDGRTVSVERISDLSESQNCSILFVSEEAGVKAEQVRSAARGSRVLTVGESPGFAEQGGMINFVTRESKIRFEVNEGVARQEGIKISSKLLRLALVIDQGGGSR